jgi:hypothetical protein
MDSMIEEWRQLPAGKNQMKNHKLACIDDYIYCSLFDEYISRYDIYNEKWEQKQTKGDVPKLGSSPTFIG